MSRGALLIVLGSMGQLPFAGVAWQALHYLEGLKRLGHDVYYIEDTGGWPYDPQQDAITEDCSYTVNYIARLMDWCGLSDRWAYRLSTDRHTYGLSEIQISHLLDGADALINLTGATVLRDEHLRVPVRIYLETDPVTPQIEVARGDQFTIGLLGAHTHHFTFGENLGEPDCGVPTSDFKYRPTRQPIVLDWWVTAAHQHDISTRQPQTPGRFTTVSNWQQSFKNIEWKGETYFWSKHLEFLKFIDLPKFTGARLELALACNDVEAKQLLTSHGWSVVDAISLSTNIHTYRDYILGSDGEFTVAKDQNIRLRSGWFSDRSACYLSAGRPVITQDTGFGNIMPTGEGLFSFNTMDEIVAAFDAINSDYQRHSLAARAIAEQYFRAEAVLSKVLDDAEL
jgi:hypothetical protein